MAKRKPVMISTQVPPADAQAAQPPPATGQGGAADEARMTGEKVRRKRVRYVPPSSEVVHQATREVCKEFGKRNPEFNRPDVVYGLAEFLNNIAKIQANRLNKLQEIGESQSLDIEPDRG